MSTDIEPAEVVEPERSIVRQDELSIEQLVGQVRKIQSAMSSVMKDNEHYGVIPGTQKPTLLKPGAEKLCLLFRLAPEYGIKETWHDDGHFTVIATCRLTHISTENFVAAGEGMCSTKESKYAYRKASLTCPSCGGNEAVRKSKQGGGWYCWSKIGGCGWKTTNDNDPAIKSQNLGKVDNPDLADSYNTVLKMACKRALIAAVLNGTAASDIFTQDVGDTEVEPEVAKSADGPPEAEPNVDWGAPAPQAAPSQASPEEEKVEVDGEVAPAESSSGDNPLKTLLQALTSRKVSQGDILRKAAEVAGKPVSRKELGTLPPADLERIVSELGLGQGAMV